MRAYLTIRSVYFRSSYFSKKRAINFIFLKKINKLLFVRHANSLITLFKPGHNLSSYQHEPPAWDFAQKLLAISLFNKTVT